jgi:hypothetical protein
MAGHDGGQAPEVLHAKPFTIKVHAFFEQYLGK